MALSGRPDMPIRRVAVDGDSLELALTSNSLDWAWVLDLRTGSVHMVGFEEGSGLSRDEIEEAFGKGDLVRVDPLESRVEFGWTAESAGTVRDPEFRERLGIALDGRGGFRRFKTVLADRPAEEDRWFAFRDVRLRREMRAWLAEQWIEPAAEPPVRRVPRGGARGVSL